MLLDMSCAAQARAGLAFWLNNSVRYHWHQTHSSLELHVPPHAASLNCSRRRQESSDTSRSLSNPS